MQQTKTLKLLFIINSGSGSDEKNWKQLIKEYFKGIDREIEIFEMPKSCKPEMIKQKIDEYKPGKVIAVGGDGTVKLAAQCLLNADVPLGILPAGSANGMAKELNIPEDATKALDIAVNGKTKKIHLTKINDELCIHLGDIGFNAFMVKKFEAGDARGMWGYAKAAWEVLWSNPRMEVKIQTDENQTQHNAAMVIIANATMYGSGALINPKGRLDDEAFEVIVIKKLSVKEIFKMMVTHEPYDKRKTEVFQTSSLNIQSRKKAHFQVDGEYLGKINNIKASILPGALDVIIPAQ